MTIINTFANIEKFEIIVNCFFVFFDVVIENTNGIIRSSLISHFSCSSTSESKHFIIFESSHHRYVCPIINFLLTLLVFFIGCSIKQRCLFDNSWRSIEEERKFNAMGLRRSHRAVIALPVELLDLILLSKWTSNSERTIEGWMITTVSFFSALH